MSDLEHVILSRRSAAKDLELRILRPFGVFAPQGDVAVVRLSSFIVHRSSFIVQKTSF